MSSALTRSAVGAIFLSLLLAVGDARATGVEDATPIDSPEPARIRRAEAMARYLAQAQAIAAEDGVAARPADADYAKRCQKALRLPWGPIEECDTAIVTVTVGTVAAAGLIAWWGDGFGTEFNVADEGWFGPDTYAGGIDKLGHAFSFYVGTRLGTRALEWAELPREDAIALSAGVAAGVGLGIEVFDGLSRGGDFGFSWQDLAMNAAGIGLGALMELEPAIDRYFAFRWLYSPKGRAGSWYDHHTYLGALRLSGFEAIGKDNPLRYLELVAGYGAKGFRSDRDYRFEDERERSLYFGVALNLTEIFDRTVFADEAQRGTGHWFTTEFLRYVQVPGTAAMAKKTWRP